MGRLKNFVKLDFCLPQQNSNSLMKRKKGQQPEFEEIDFEKQPFVVCSKANDIMDVNRSDYFKIGEFFFH